MYIKSKQLNIIRDEIGRSFVYHGLYNNPRILDESLTSLINEFSEQKSIDDIRERYDGEVNEIIDEFVRLGYIHCTRDVEDRSLMHAQKEFLLKVERGGNLSRLELAISNSCNLACPHCMHFINNGLQNNSQNMNMSIDTAKKCIDTFVSKVREQGNNIVRIHFGNGEPLINWNTISFVLDYTSMLEDIEFSFAINTNLTLLSKQMAEKLKQYRVKISTSLDGTKIGNDLVRIDRKGNGTFDNIIDKFDLLREIGFPIDGFSVTVTDTNYNHIDQGIIDLASSLGVQEVSMDYDLVSSIQIPIKDCVKKIVSLRNYAKGKGIHFYGNWETPFKILMSSSWRTSPHAYCPAMEGTTLEFNVDGTIKVCGHTNTVIGKDCDLESVLCAGSDYLSLLSARLPGNNRMCVDCEIEGACAGQCHVTIESSKRDNKIMENMCALMKETTKALINDYMATH